MPRPHFELCKYDTERTVGTSSANKTILTILLLCKIHYPLDRLTLFSPNTRHNILRRCDNFAENLVRFGTKPQSRSSGAPQLRPSRSMRWDIATCAVSGNVNRTTRQLLRREAFLYDAPILRSSFRRQTTRNGRTGGFELGHKTNDCEQLCPYEN